MNTEPLKAPTTPAIQFAVQTVWMCLRTLQKADDLSPQAPHIHVALSALEGLCRTPYSASDIDAILAQLGTPTLQALRNLLADAEHHDEHHHADNILRAANDSFNLDARIQSVYAKMVQSELQMIGRTLPLAVGTRCTFVGCGALPLTAIYINHFAGLQVDALDCHQPCCSVGNRVIRHIANDRPITVHHARGEKYDFSNTPLVYVASMVPNKREVFACIAATNPDAHVLTRGGHGLRQVFYSAVDIDGLLSDGWTCIGVTPPPEGVKNTSYLFRRT
jgi:hypothetical protein